MRHSLAVLATLLIAGAAPASAISDEVAALADDDFRTSWAAARALVERSGGDSAAIRVALGRFLEERGYAIELRKRLRRDDRGAVIDRIRQAALLARLKERGVVVPEGMVAIPGGVAPRPLTGEPVEVAPFLIDRIEVTQAEWRRYAAETETDGDVVREGSGRMPVVGIDRASAERFAHWRKARLPSAEEWLIARGGCARSTYPWGDRWAKGAANALTAEGAGGPEPAVGRPEGATSLGVLRMAGNAAEWTSSDWGAPRTERGVVAGESWLTAPGVGPVLRATPVSSRPPSAGLRCAASVP